jgi:hypothetical protein
VTGPPSRKSSSAAGAIPEARRLLTGFIDLKRSTVDIQTVEFRNCLLGVICRSEFHESEAA